MFIAINAILIDETIPMAYTVFIGRTYFKVG